MKYLDVNFASENVSVKSVMRFISWQISISLQSKKIRNLKLL